MRVVDVPRPVDEGAIGRAGSACRLDAMEALAENALGDSELVGQPAERCVRRLKTATTGDRFSELSGVALGVVHEHAAGVVRMCLIYGEVVDPGEAIATSDARDQHGRAIRPRQPHARSKIPRVNPPLAISLPERVIGGRTYR